MSPLSMAELTLLYSPLLSVRNSSSNIMGDKHETRPTQMVSLLEEKHIIIKKKIDKNSKRNRKVVVISLELF
jgi:hypothetical protein